ncbi:MAG: hypothetical protein JNL93_25645 [Pelomonas sp.]|nr:hypothetical protein [Roseateles sp.]
MKPAKLVTNAVTAVVIGLAAVGFANGWVAYADLDSTRFKAQIFAACSERSWCTPAKGECLSTNFSAVMKEKLGRFDVALGYAFKTVTLGNLETPDYRKFQKPFSLVSEEELRYIGARCGT